MSDFVKWLSENFAVQVKRRRGKPHTVITKGIGEHSIISVKICARSDLLQYISMRHKHNPMGLPQFIYCLN